ncbi:mCG19559 [Mus musculus]|nr:mCG19559 [Mus musculus]
MSSNMYSFTTQASMDGISGNPELSDTPGVSAVHRFASLLPTTAHWKMALRNHHWFIVIALRFVFRSWYSRCLTSVSNSTYQVSSRPSVYE